VYNTAILIKTINGVIIEKYTYDFDTDAFITNTFSAPVVLLTEKIIYGGEWYFHDNNTIQCFTLEWVPKTNTKPSYLSMHGYIYDIDGDTFRENYKGAVSTLSTV
jgi:hypothetical protein